MANFIPTVHIQSRNIHQRIIKAAHASGTELKTLKIPPYVIDYRVLAAIRLENVSYLEDYLFRTPRFINSNFYLEITTCTNPVIQHYFYMPLLGFALYYGSSKMTKYFLGKGADINHACFSVEFEAVPSLRGRTNEKITIKRIHILMLLYKYIDRNESKKIYELYQNLYSLNIDFGVSLSVESQVIYNNEARELVTSWYKNLFDYLRSQFANQPDKMKQSKATTVNSMENHFYKRDPPAPGTPTAAAQPTKQVPQPPKAVASPEVHFEVTPKRLKSPASSNGQRDDNSQIDNERSTPENTYTAPTEADGNAGEISIRDAESTESEWA